MAASDNRSSSSLSMSALVSSAIGLQAGFSTNCRRHALQAYLALPLWICPFRTTRLEPQLGHLGRGCFSLIPPLYNHYPLITIQFWYTEAHHQSHSNSCTAVHCRRPDRSLGHA